MADDADNRSSDNAAADAFIELSTSQSFLIDLSDLRKPEVRERLRRIWTDPLSVDNRFVTAKA